MAKVSMWWVFLACFALMIGGIQALGAWSRPLCTQAPSKGGEDFTTAAARHRNCEAKHWRSVFMQQ
jgi:hypothetical protein